MKYKAYKTFFIKIQNDLDIIKDDNTKINM